MKKLLTTLSILLIATVGYAHSEAAHEGGTYTIEQVIDESLITQLRDIADKWIQLMDEGLYAEAWEQTSVQHKTGWDKKGIFIRNHNTSLRKTYGNVISRKFNFIEYRDGPIKIPKDSLWYGQADRVYIRIKYKTIYEWPDTETVWDEAVVFMIDEDGQWRVCGYGGTYFK